MYYNLYPDLCKTKAQSLSHQSIKRNHIVSIVGISVSLGISEFALDLPFLRPVKVISAFLSLFLKLQYHSCTVQLRTDGWK